MLEKVLNDSEFALMMQRNVKECVEFLLKKEFSFSVMANLELVLFNPDLPKEIKDTFKFPAIVFELGGYTLQSAFIKDDELKFEAGFGENDFASVVSVPLASVIQIVVDNSPILVNFAITKSKKEDYKRAKSRKIFSLEE
ncbi:hypothetical protein [Campylobacter geochelonis]|uniref:Uncharacterized protein n=1 Tax=Campylobacter geochelonis TaxID=1780362 RepID=A0A128EGW3_9BACT|nr:hypothetical protein [Campylobacter geochelonis]QKF70958.1 hypothetical protein CGEO_0637 [Campylobacter geochelonis]CZE47037.1 Uncharacterised protein [Campylobacter geochelonis]CZE47528.1 Uncharacterised protein [Campylobacter geochelonis]CZE50226.1 Uncharacterised protein [Campylobacter geochelonis]